ncbi:hypothetical protein [Paenibacillus sp. SN-8-1]|uniref:hypothetical protein n=1 Tax=Paenibacillus sp. SN-8-1 TaxID=3435409 RepID=UPI003D9A605E
MIAHTVLLLLGLIQLSKSIPLGILLGSAAFVVGSRVMNGIALFGKNHGRHYIVTCGILLLALGLHLGGL